MTHVTCRLTAKNRDQLRSPTLGSRVRATFLLPGCPNADSDGKRDVSNPTVSTPSGRFALLQKTILPLTLSK